MSATEDESQSLDAGWDDEAPSEPGEDDVDQAWDSLPPPTSSAASAATPSMAPATEEVDSGWDDVPEGAPQHVPGKRRPHRQRRAKTGAVAVSQNPVLMPRPAEPTKKHQREHARKLRAQEALVREQRKQEKKAQRAAEAREEAAARLRQTEAEALARAERLEEQKRNSAARSAKKAARPKRAVAAKQSEKHSEKKTLSSSVELKEKETLAHKSAPKSGLRPGVIVTLVVLAVVALLVLLSK
jgi:hypothetical protein